MKKFITSFILLMALLFLPGIQVKAANITQTDTEKTSVTVEWEAPSNENNGYYLYVFDTDIESSDRQAKIENKEYYATVDPTQTTYTITDLNPGDTKKLYIYYDHPSYDGTTIYTYQVGNLDIKTVPDKVANVRQDKWWYYIGSVDATWDAQKVNGYDYEFYNAKNELLKADTKNYNSEHNICSLEKVKNNQMYYVRVRAFQNLNNTSDDSQRVYGEWSGKSVLFTQPMINTASVTSSTKKVNGKKVTTNKLNIKFDKVSGMTSYQIYVSTKEKSGYKLVKTLASDKNSASITKIGDTKIKKNKTYYVYVVGVRKTKKGNKYTSGRHYTVSVNSKSSSFNLNWTFD